ncbi:uncharacterized protein N7529_004720 [Penicillium soppii]|uniref:uncharacterized protein n=1 Tax=Penicillium soppii TaxID=69789 RepID=UPI002546CFA1|nr:uncharacterized protein N7529_004720 [Penicillium soppii]KAJ5872367.1 hypothetical protein N7529_004720 [Penicillium soppii]
MTQAVPRVEASNEHESPDKNAVEHDSPSERNRKRVRLCLPHEERMKQEHQIEQMIMHRLEADKLQFPDRWDLTHELFCERDSERSEFYDRARWEAEIELCGHLGIPNLKVQIFSAEEEPLEDPRLSENERTTLDYELEAQLGTEQQDIIDGTIDNPLAIYISDDEMESGLQIEPDVASGPGLRSSIRIASGLVGETI